jgi:hypothetical protein
MDKTHFYSILFHFAHGHDIERARHIGVNDGEEHGESRRS